VSSSNLLTLAVSGVLGGGLFAAIGQLILLPWTRRRLGAQSGRDAAEAVERLSTTAVSTVEKLELQMERMDTMRQQISDMRRQLSAAEDQAADLIAALAAANERARLAEAERDQLRDEIAAKRRARRDRHSDDTGTAGTGGT
jgi:chromosome segregation ATPase